MGAQRRSRRNGERGEVKAESVVKAKLAQNVDGI